ncbi:hypothetical protein HDU78_008203 [Chytriomyces hyalinus]|nr:hypothetical protein HDU78_008203 [Chytriomyces hyalinus]
MYWNQDGSSAVFLKDKKISDDDEEDGCDEEDDIIWQDADFDEQQDSQDMMKNIRQNRFLEREREAAEDMDAEAIAARMQISLSSGYVHFAAERGGSYRPSENVASRMLMPSINNASLWKVKCRVWSIILPPFAAKIKVEAGARIAGWRRGGGQPFDVRVRPSEIIFAVATICALRNALHPSSDLRSFTQNQAVLLSSLCIALSLCAYLSGRDSPLSSAALSIAVGAVQTLPIVALSALSHLLSQSPNTLINLMSHHALIPLSYTSMFMLARAISHRLDCGRRDRTLWARV